MTHEDAVDELVELVRGAYVEGIYDGGMCPMALSATLWRESESKVDLDEILDRLEIK